MRGDDDDYKKLGGWTEEDVEEPDFEGQTVSGGWWSTDQQADDENADGENTKREPGKPSDRRAHPRVAFSAQVELIPPDGAVHECQAVNLSLGGVLLEKTNPGPLPELGQMVVIEIPKDEVALDAVVVRVEADTRRFAGQFVNLDNPLREYLKDAVGVEHERSTTSYMMSKKKEPGGT